jgi:hypothetical protein
MRRLHCVTLGVALGLAVMVALPAVAGSQSSNSSSNCSNGRCTRVDTYREEDKRGSWNWTRYDSWYERPRTERDWRSKSRRDRREYDKHDDD